MLSVCIIHDSYITLNERSKHWWLKNCLPLSKTLCFHSSWCVRICIVYCKISLKVIARFWCCVHLEMGKLFVYSQESLSTLIKYFVDTHYSSIESVTYVETFSKLKQQREQLQRQQEQRLAENSRRLSPHYLILLSLCLFHTAFIMPAPHYCVYSTVLN